MEKINKIYRLSDKGHKPTFPIGISKEICLKNFICVFGIKDLIVIADNCEQQTIKLLQSLNIKDIRQTSLGNSGSLKFAFEIAYNELSQNDIVYFVEDDFLHIPDADRYLLEGIEIADYVSLYDHLDKYMNPSQNPFVKDGGENCKVLLTRSTHWKTTNSTVQTFATKVRTLIEDRNILYKYNFKSNTPQSFATFLELTKMGRRLITPIQGISTACDSFPSPIVDWEFFMKDFS
jgi:hypothetical protein